MSIELESAKERKSMKVFKSPRGCKMSLIVLQHNFAVVNLGGRFCNEIVGIIR